jgi:hypothetical protein
MSPVDATDLWALRSGRDPARLAVVRAPEPCDGSSPPPNYQTIALHEFHALGADGLPAHHRTVHVIRAVDTVVSYSYRFDTDAAAVEVVRGGTAGPLYQSSEDGLFGVDIAFPRPLRPGETASFEYRTIFKYKAPPPPEFRRGGRRRSSGPTTRHGHPPRGISRARVGPLDPPLPRHPRGTHGGVSLALPRRPVVTVRPAPPRPSNGTTSPSGEGLRSVTTSGTSRGSRRPAARRAR